MTQGLLAETLRVLRAQRGLSQARAAEMIGIDRHTLRDLERGTGRKPGYPTLHKIARGYGVPVSELMQAAGLLEESTVPLGEAPSEPGLSETEERLDLLRGYEEAFSGVNQMLRTELARRQSRRDIQGLIDLVSLAALASIGAQDFVRGHESMQPTLGESPAEADARERVHGAVRELNSTMNEIRTATTALQTPAAPVAVLDEYRQRRMESA